MNLPFYILAYLMILNFSGLLLCWLNNHRAKKGIPLIQDRWLILAGSLGGCFGIGTGALLFRQKYRPYKAKLLIPIQFLMWGMVCIHTVSAVTLDRKIQYLEISYQSSKITPDLDHYRIAFVTDTHSMTAGELGSVVEQVNGYHPDLLVLGGDFPSLEDAPERSMQILSQVVATDGIYGVEGNHDNYKTLFAAMQRHGIMPLSNNGLLVRENLYLAGVEDLWNRSPDIAKAVEGSQQGDFILLVSHNPDLTMVQDTKGVDLILSGHTHGGQITFFRMIAPALSFRNTITEYGNRFQSGWAKSRDGADVYVSNGTGYLSNVPRVFARPQVILLTLRQEEASNPA